MSEGQCAAWAAGILSTCLREAERGGSERGRGPRAAG